MAIFISAIWSCLADEESEEIDKILSCSDPAVLAAYWALLWRFAEGSRTAVEVYHSKRGKGGIQKGRFSSDYCLCNVARPSQDNQCTQRFFSMNNLWTCFIYFTYFANLSCYAIIWILFTFVLIRSMYIPVPPPDFHGQGKTRKGLMLWRLSIIRRKRTAEVLNTSHFVLLKSYSTN